MSLVDNIAAALAASTTLATWCDAKYDQAQTVQLGIDMDRLPSDSEFPLVMVAQVSGREGRTLERETADCLVVCGIADAAGPTTVGRLKKFGQVGDLETFRKQVLAVVEAADLLGGYVAEVVVENDPVELFPIFSTNMIVRIEYPAPMRGRWNK